MSIGIFILLISLANLVANIYWFWWMQEFMREALKDKNESEQ